MGICTGWVKGCSVGEFYRCCLMFHTVLKDISRPHVLDILLLLKRGTGMSVNEISAALEMSYMGIKQHCIYLEKKGYLDTWKRPKPAGGRPEKVYRLTVQIAPLFPTTATEMTLDVLAAADMAFGHDAANRLLLHFFQRRMSHYQEQVDGNTLMRRAQSLAQIRTSEGCLSFAEMVAEDQVKLVEYHSPLAGLAAHYPVASDLEAQMVGRALQCLAERVDCSENGVVRIEFRLRPMEEIVRSHSVSASLVEA
jgi:predicted ArsR family transcriptional regulator